jgi:CheY-like chemotaxis protein
LNLSLETPLRILMADDDPDDRMLAHDAFAECDAVETVGFAEDGAELLERLQSLAEAQRLPRLVLLDWNMPRKNGLEALLEMKENPALRNIPVVILTTSRDSVDVAAAYNAGAAGFMTKPVTFEGLTAFIREMIARYAPEVAGA